jgi:hypothetical protein
LRLADPQRGGGTAGKPVKKDSINGPKTRLAISSESTRSQFYYGRDASRLKTSHGIDIHNAVFSFYWGVG